MCLNLAVAMLQENTHFNGGGARSINMSKFEERFQFHVYVIFVMFSFEDFQRKYCRDLFSTRFLPYVILITL
jgi:hypothetical protein